MRTGIQRSGSQKTGRKSAFEGSTGIRQRVLLTVLVLSALLLSGCGMKILTPDDGMGGGGDKASRVVSSARSQVGAPYRMGGTTPRGFDCSGLIWWAYRQQGVTVPRVTTDQASAGRSVRRGSMQPGDILVFRTREGRTGLHTALYAGRGEFIHSPSSGKRVRKDKLSMEYWDRRLIRVRRILR